MRRTTLGIAWGACATVLAATACSGGAAPATDPGSSAPPVSAAAPPASAIAPPSAPVVAATGLPVPASFGVAECDHYAALACGCSNEAMRATLCEGVRTSFVAWESAVRLSATNRDAIVTACTGSEAALATTCPGTVVSTSAASTQAAAIAIAAAVAAPAAATWDGHSPFSCATGNVTLTGITGSVPGESAIYAAGDCHLTLTNMVVGGEIAVEAAGMSVVTIVGGTFTGTRSALYAGGEAHVTATGATFVGGVERGGSAVVTGAE